MQVHTKHSQRSQINNGLTESIRTNTSRRQITKRMFIINVSHFLFTYRLTASFGDEYNRFTGEEGSVDCLTVHAVTVIHCTVIREKRILIHWKNKWLMHVNILQFKYSNYTNRLLSSYFIFSSLLLKIFSKYNYSGLCWNRKTNIIYYLPLLIILNL